MTKVLVFEADPSFAGELRTELGRLGAAVQVVDDGNVGLQAAATERPDLILLSIELPRMNGFSVCNKLKKDPSLKDVPLVIMSSESSEETFEQHRKLKTRAEDYLTKPFEPGVRIERLAALGISAPEGAVAAPEAEVVTIDDVEEIESTLAALDAAATAPPPEDDGELRAFDEAFDAIAPADAVPIVPAQPAVVEPEAPAVEPEAPAVEPVAPAVELAAARAPAMEPELEDAELARLRDRISELRVEAARSAEQRERLEARVAEAERAATEARRRVAELEAQVAQHEQRVVRAYQRLKGDEKVREKTRKALAIALQLLETGAQPAAAPQDPARETPKS
jgi:CheY-like chemotaxis protein